MPGFVLARMLPRTPTMLRDDMLQMDRGPSGMRSIVIYRFVRSFARILGEAIELLEQGRPVVNHEILF